MISQFSSVTYNKLKKLSIFVFNYSVHLTFRKVIGFIRTLLDRHPASVSSTLTAAAGVPATVLGSVS